MKIFISADIEGITGVTHWDETEKTKSDHKEFAHQMTLEVKAACEGAIDAGADEIWIKDAHDTARNIDHKTCFLEILNSSEDGVVTYILWCKDLIKPSMH